MGGGKAKGKTPSKKAPGRRSGSSPSSQLAPPLCSAAEVAAALTFLRHVRLEWRSAEGRRL